MVAKVLDNLVDEWAKAYEVTSASSSYHTYIFDTGAVGDKLYIVGEEVENGQYSAFIMAIDGSSG